MGNSENKMWSLIERTVGDILELVFKCIKKELSEDTRKTFIQFLKFGIVGVSNTVVFYIIYAVSLLAFQKMGIFAKIDYLVAHIMAFALSVLWSFYWNDKLVFTLEVGEERSIWKALLKTYISYSFTGLFLNSILLIAWVKILNISEFIAPIINLLVSVPINFFINKFWAFESK